MTMKLAAPLVAVLVGALGLGAEAWIVHRHRPRAHDLRLVGRWVDPDDRLRGLTFHADGRYDHVRRGKRYGCGLWSTEKVELTYRGLVDEDELPTDRRCDYQIEDRELHLDSCGALSDGDVRRLVRPGVGK